MIIFGFNSNFKRVVLELWDRLDKLASKELTKYDEIINLEEKVADLIKQKTVLEIEVGKKQEEYDRRDREIEHKIGLERKRQVQELELSKREATVAIREENLKADRDRFEGQIQFHEKRFTEEVKYLKDMIQGLTEALPTMKIRINKTDV